MEKKFENVKDRAVYSTLPDERIALIKEAKDEIKTADLASVMKVKTVITFKDQRLLNFWTNFMSGQLSDGAWENSNNTDWLWAQSLAGLGDENRVIVLSAYVVGRKTYKWDKTFEELIDDGTCTDWITDSGFADKKEFKAAFNTVSNMIRDYTEDYDLIDGMHKAAAAMIQERVAASVEKLKSIGFVHRNDTTYSTCWYLPLFKMDKDINDGPFPPENVYAVVNTTDMRAYSGDRFPLKFIGMRIPGQKVINPFTTYIQVCSTVEEVIKTCGIVKEAIEKLSEIFIKK